jgi:hypothetical protein
MGPVNSLDFNIFVLGLLVMLIFMLFGLIKDKIEWSVFPGMAIVIGLILHTSLLADGSLTNVSGGLTVVIASASTAVSSAWQFIQYFPLIFTVGAFFIVVYRVGNVIAK